MVYCAFLGDFKTFQLQEFVCSSRRSELLGHLREGVKKNEIFAVARVYINTASDGCSYVIAHLYKPSKIIAGFSSRKI